MTRAALSIALFVGLTVVSLTLRAQPTADEAKKDEARQLFERGLALYEQGAWDPALAEFLTSRSLYPTRSATKNAALCLKNLQRFAESLEMFEALLAEFPDLAPADRAVAERAIAELGGMVGMVELRGAPDGAAVSVDGRRMAVPSTAKPLRVSAGARVIRVDQQGFAPFETRAVVLAGKTAVVDVELVSATKTERLTVVERQETASDTVKAPETPASPGNRFLVEVDAAGALTSSFGGVDSGSGEIGVGYAAVLHLGYELRSGFGFGVSAGYLRLSLDRDDRVYEVVPPGEPANRGTVDHQLDLRGLIAGATASLHLGQRFPGLFRFGAGVLVGSVEDARRGTFVTEGGATYETGVLRDSPGASFFFLAPEARVGFRFTDHFEASLGIAAHVLVALGKPTWQNRRAFAAADAGAASFPEEELTGGVIVVLTPGAGLRYDF